MRKGVGIASGTATDFRLADGDDMVFMGLPGRRKLRQIAVQHCHEAAPVFEDILGPVVDVKAQVKRLKGRFTDAAAAAGHAVTQAGFGQ